MSSAIDLAKDTIRRGKVDVLHAQYVSGGSKCGELETTDQDAMCEYLDTLESSLTGDVRVTLRSSKVDRKRGAKPVAQLPYEYIIKCGRGRVPSVPPATTNSTAPTAAALPSDIVYKSGENAARAQTLEERLNEALERIDALEEELEEADEEAEAVHATLNAAPPPPPLPFYATEQGGAAIIKLLQPISDAAAAFMLNGFKRPSGPPPQNRVAAAPSAEGITPEELRAIAAMRNFRAENPEQAETVLDTLLSNYAAPTPDANGQG